IVAGSMMAVNPLPTKTTKGFTPLKGELKSQGPYRTHEVSRSFRTDKTMEITGMQRVKKSTRSEEGSGSKYEGTYILTLCDDVFTNSTGAQTSMEVNVTVNNNKLTISCEDIDPIIADFNESTGTVTFVNQYLGETSTAAYSYLPVDFNKQEMFSTVVATFNEEGTALKFPSDTGIMEGCWQWGTVAQKNDAISAAQSFDTTSKYLLGYVYGQTFVSMTKGAMTFSSVGKATYYDGLMTVNDGVSEIFSWEIEVEKCNEVENYYRIQPYAVENPVGTALNLGVDPETYIYINAANANKVYTKGEFTPYGLTTFCGVNGENNFDADFYGTFSDKIFTFPSKSFAYENEKKWYLVDSEDQPNLRIVFEGATIKDYTLEAFTASTVNKDNKWTIELTKGADVASVKYMILPMEIDYDELVQYGITLESDGTEVTGDSFTIEPAKNNLFGTPMTESEYVTVFIASFNDTGIKQEQTQLDLVVLFQDEEEGWKTVGTTEFKDPFIAPVFGETFSAEVEVQAKADNSAMYRLVLPYQTYPADFNLAGLTTSMVIDATDPSWVEIPAYISGVDLGFGVTAVGSIAALGYDKNNVPSGVGAITLSGNIVNLASKSAFVHLPLYSGAGLWSQLNAGGEIALPAISLTVTVKDDKGEVVEGAAISLKDVIATDQETLTDSKGQATVEIPFSVGYFGSLNVYVNNNPNKVTLKGASNESEITISDSAVTEIFYDNKVNEVYDILGRKVTNPTPGLYIVNGKKTLIK
ncbi:MAG: Ig-like domain-containing protein, partial [Muribaculaceae bacterium]|nr:Ig-like domain-containing protein [Muribaculaceae bacterium]